MISNGTTLYNWCLFTNNITLMAIWCHEIKLQKKNIEFLPLIIDGKLLFYNNYDKFIYNTFILFHWYDESTQNHLILWTINGWYINIYFDISDNIKLVKVIQ